MAGRYENALNFYKDFNLCRIGENYSIDWKTIPAEKLEPIVDEICFYDGNGRDIVRYITVEEADLWEHAEYFDFDGAERAFALEDLLKPSNHYLVMAHSCRWNGASGYKIVDSLDEVLNRDYEVSIYPTAVSKGGKCLVCRESSHDVPMGATTSITALTESEYARLSAWYTDWDTVAKFAETNEAKAKGGAA